MNARTARGLFAVALAVGIGAFVVETSAPLAVGPADAVRPCGQSFVRARIDGKQVCLRRGERCSRRLDRQYHRYGFHCHSGRLTRVSPSPRPAPKPPAGATGAIIFSSGGDIVAVNVGERAERRLTSDAAHDDGPAWSPSGSQVAFASNRFGNADLYVMAADGSSVTRVTSNSADDVGPVWSPDGSRIAFRRQAGENFSVWIVNVDGTGEALVYAEREGYVGVQDWSQDGSELLLSIDHTAGGQLDTYTIKSDGSGLRQLTREQGDDSGARWSPDGDKIVFWSDRAGGGVYTMNADGSGVTRILRDTLDLDIARLAWSPDGRFIAWTGKFEGGRGTAIYVMNANGTGSAPITRDVGEATELDWRATAYNETFRAAVRDLGT